MIRKIVGALVLVPLAILIVLFAVANRASIVLSFDPFSSDAPASVARVPLFLALLAALIVGVVVGGVAAWLKQAKSRRAARRLERDLRGARASPGSAAPARRRRVAGLAAALCVD